MNSRKVIATNTTTATRTAARAVDSSQARTAARAVESSQANSKTPTPSNLKYKVNG